MELDGATAEDFAQVKVKNAAAGLHNPNARYRKADTVENNYTDVIPITISYRTFEGINAHVLLNITGGSDLGLFEVNEAAEIIQGATDQNSNIIFGAVVDDGLEDNVRVTVIATGFEGARSRPLFAEDSTGRRREPRRRDVSMDDNQRSSLEISDDDIDIPSFLKD